MQSKRSESSPERPFRHVGENLYRRESSGVYYALLKKGRKQFRRSLRTTDRELVRRRLAELRAQIGVLTSDDARKVTFDVVAQRWLDSVRHTLKESTARRREQYLRALSPFFAGLSLREITPAHCEAWVTKRGDKIAPQTFAHELERRGRAPAVSQPHRFASLMRGSAGRSVGLLQPLGHVAGHRAGVRPRGSPPEWPLQGH